MSISTYSELQTAAANWLNDTELTARIPEFITLGEARLNRELRTRTMETTDALVTVAGSRVVALPSRFLEPLALFIELTGGRESLTFIPSNMPTDATDGEPLFWTIDGTDIAFEREADQVYNLSLKYLKKLDIAADSTNWLLSNYPDAYLAATLAEGFAYDMDEERAAFWLAKLSTLITEINGKESRSRSLAKLRNTELAGLLGNSRWNINTDRM